jgi:hypothetical protein
LREDFETWRTRELADEDIRYVFMDGWYPKVGSAAAASAFQHDRRHGCPGRSEQSAPLPCCLRRLDVGISRFGHRRTS